MARISARIDSCPASSLLGSASAPLSGWYADPLAAAVASEMLVQVRIQQQTRLRAGNPCFQLQVLAMVCHDWLGGDAELGYTQLAVLAAEDFERALLEIVQGQLLASRKISGALEHLQAGFRLASPMLEPARYFELVRRHELLGCLPCSATPSAPQDLESLLNEAAVIERLRNGERRQPVSGHLDTVS